MVGIYKMLTDTRIVEIGTEAVQFLLWEYLFQNIGNVSLQCTSWPDNSSTAAVGAQSIAPAQSIAHGQIGDSISKKN